MTVQWIPTTCPPWIIRLAMLCQVGHIYFSQKALERSTLSPLINDDTTHTRSKLLTVIESRPVQYLLLLSVVSFPFTASCLHTIEAEQIFASNDEEAFHGFESPDCDFHRGTADWRPRSTPCLLSSVYRLRWTMVNLTLEIMFFD